MNALVMNPSDPAGLDALFSPRSIAVVGASSNPAKIGGLPIHLLKTYGYAGSIYPINPKAEQIQGLTAFARISNVDAPIDLAICAVPAEKIEEAVADVVRARVRALIVFSSGFAEVGARGREMQQRIAVCSREAGVRLLGPNCLGAIHMRSNTLATFSPALLSGLPEAGGIAIVSQSGAFGIFVLVRARERGLGISHFIATGNEADIDFADCISYLVRQDEVRVILGYLEGARDGNKLVDALEMARKVGKPVAICKVGTSVIGAAAAASHTASLAGRDEIYDAVFRQCGVYRAASIDELFDIGYACDVSVPMRSRRLGIISISGGAGVHMADAAEKYGLEVPPMPHDSQQRILARVPFASPTNPIDITGQALQDIQTFDEAVGLMGSARFGAIASFQALTGVTPQHRPMVTQTWARFRTAHPDVAVAVVTVFDEEDRRFLEARRCLAFEEPKRAVRALAALAAFARERDAEPAAPETAAAVVVDLSLGPFDERASLAVLEQAGVPTVSTLIAQSAEEAVAAASELGFPVVLKVLSADIPHKSDVGGVALGLRDADEVRSAFDRILTSIRAKMPQAQVNGLLVAPMIRGGVECVLGVTHDPVFGPMVMFGLGGTLVEVLHDVVFRRAPFSRYEAQRMIRSIRGYLALTGVRGAPPADVEALADALSSLSRFAAANQDRLASVDVNPLLVLPAGRGVVAVDALIVTGEKI